MQPYLNVPTRYRQQTSRFGGLDRSASILQGQFADMENLCADQYPVLSTRPGRVMDLFPEKTDAMLAGTGLMRVEGDTLVLPDRRVRLGLVPGEEKTLVAMGAYVLVFPDKKYVNLSEPEDYGSMEAEFTTDAAATLTPCALDGGERKPDFVQPDAPEEPTNRALWLDTSEEPPVLKQWSGAGELWVTEETPYIRLEAAGIGNHFRVYDALQLSGAGTLDGANTVWAVGEDYLVLTGVLEDRLAARGITLSRRVPDMDFVTECGNRLWGCRAGKNARGETVNEIYASRLGDFRNWESFLGLSTDSYTVSVGTPGPFTGAITHLGTPLFFKEDCLYKIYGSYPANFRVQCTPCRGVQPGCGRSLAIVGELLYYKSPMGVCAFDGSLPQEIGKALGMEPFENALGTGFGEKYYLSMEDSQGKDAIYVYDTYHGIWHKETGIGARQLTACRGKLYGLDKAGKVHCLRGEESLEKVEWTAITGRIDGWEPERYLTGITLHMVLAPFARAEVLVRYDSQGAWEAVGGITGRGERFRLPIRPRRCSHLELMLRGEGQMQLYSLTRILQKGRNGL